MVTKTLTIVFTDIKGFTERTSRTSRADMMRILKKHEELLKPFIIRHGGKVVKTIGDAFLLTFESPTNAVLCGLRMQARLKQYNAEVSPDDLIEIRIAINSGEVEVVDKDVFGETVNLASRVEGVTKAGEIYFTETTYLVMNKSEVPTSEVGEFQFKGIPNLVRLFRVVQDENLDLYKKVVSTQAVCDKIIEEEASVPEGAYSVNLLQALEEQRKKKAVRQAVITVALLVLVAGAYFGFRSYQYSSHRARAEQLISDGQVNQALELLTALRDEKPTDTELFNLLGKAVDANVRQLLSKKQYEEAIRVLEEYRKTYPNLNMELLDRDSRLEYAMDLIINKSRGGGGRAYKEKGFKIQKQLLGDFSKDLEIRFKIGKAFAEADNPNTAVAWFLRVVDNNPDVYKDNELVIESVKISLEKGRVLKETLDLIDKWYYEIVKPILLENIADPVPNDSRISAYYLLKKRDDLLPSDEFRFFRAELFTLGPIYIGFRDALNYFENLIKNGYPEEVKNIEQDGSLPDPVILKYGKSSGTDLKLYKRAVPVLRTFFPEVLAEVKNK